MKRILISVWVVLLTMAWAAILPAGATPEVTELDPDLQRLLLPVSTAARDAAVLEAAVTEIGENYAILEWVTDTEATEEVYYGYLPDHDMPMLSLTAAEHHSVRLENLLRGTEYRYTISGMEDVSGTFATLGVPPPLFKKMWTEMPDCYSVALRWTTNVPTSYRFGLKKEGEENYTIVSSSDTYRAENVIEIDGLTPLRKYIYIIEGADSTGYQINTGERSFVMPENNIALHKPVTGTFLYYPDDPYVRRDSEPLANITDDDDAYFTGMAQSGNIDAEEQWVAIDLGEAYPVATVISVWRTLACPLAFAVYGSRDGERWSMVADEQSAADGETGRSRRGDPIYTHTLAADGERYRYIRIVIPQGSDYHTKYPQWHFVQLMEVKIYPEE